MRTLLDTWSAPAVDLPPTLGWPDRRRVKTFHPTMLLVPALTSSFFWVARIDMLTMHLMKHDDGTAQIPFQAVYVHGLCSRRPGARDVQNPRATFWIRWIIIGTDIDLESLVAAHQRFMMQPNLADRSRSRPRQFPDGYCRLWHRRAAAFTHCSVASMAAIQVRYGPRRGTATSATRSGTRALWMMRCEDKGFVALHREVRVSAGGGCGRRPSTTNQLS